MIKKLVHNLTTLRSDLLFSKKLKKLKGNSKLEGVDQAMRSEYQNYWKSKGLKAKTQYYDLYSNISMNIGPYYVPENLYYSHFEPALNNKAMLKTYSNKNLYQLIYDNKKLFPQVYARAINGSFYSSNYQHLKEIKKLIEEHNPNSFIIKIALDSGGGRGVELFTKKNNQYIGSNGITFDENNLLKDYGSDFIIQEYIAQHSFFKQFNESSVNTIRVFTYRSVKTEEIHILHSILRIGKPGSIVDNQASGGMSCGIKNKTLNSFAVDKNGIRFTEINGYKFNEQAQIPYFEEVLTCAKNIAAQNHYARLLGLDFCIDQTNNIRLLEVNNSNNEINFYQMNNGPLFGEFTNEIVDWCSSHPKTICIDFSI